MLKLKLYTRFFYKQRFYKQHQAEIGKKNQHLEAEVLLFENYSHSSPMLSSKSNNRTHSKK